MAWKRPQILIKNRQYYALRFLIVTAILIVSIIIAPQAKCTNANEKKAIELIDEGEKAFNDQQVAAAISYFIEAKDIAAANSLPELECLAYYNIGVSYFELFENGEALDNFLQAYRISLDHEISITRKLEIAYGISGVYYRQEYLDKAKEMLLRSLPIAQEKDDKIMIENMLISLAMICNKKGDYEQALIYCQESEKYHETGPNRGDVIKAEALFLQKKYGELYKLSLDIIKSDNITSTDKGLIYRYLLDIYRQRKEYTLALEAADSARRLCDISNMPNLMNTISETYKEIGDFPNALAYKDSMVFSSDSIINSNNLKLIESNNVKLEVFKTQAERDQELSRIKQRNSVMILLSGIFLLIIIIISILAYLQRQRYKHRREIMELNIQREQEERQLAEERMKETELIAHYRQQMIKQELDKRNTELSAKALFISSRNKLLEGILKYIAEHKDISGNPTIKQLAQHLKALLKENNEEDHFIINFEAANPDFSRRLLQVHPNLLPSDLKFLAYIRMNISTKDMAIMLNVNPDSCKRRKIRIAKKLGLASSSELYEYLLSL